MCAPSCCALGDASGVADSGERLVFLGEKRRCSHHRRQHGILAVAIGVGWVAAKHLGFHEFLRTPKSLHGEFRQGGWGVYLMDLPDAAYEASVAGFVDWLATNPRARRVRKDLARCAHAIDKAALTKSLGQIVLKLATPGVPDIYQGQEARYFSFVDPDNRRPIDFAARGRVLDDLASGDELSLRQLLRSSRGAHAKEFVTWRMLQLRREDPDLFELGEYLPLKPSGDGASRVTAFARRHGDHWLIVLAPRLTHPALGRHVDHGPAPGTRPVLQLPTGCPTSWRDVLEGKGVRAAGRILPLTRTIRDGVPVVLLNA